MYFVYKVKFGRMFSLVSMIANLEEAQALARRVKGIIRRGGFDGQTICDYRS